LANFDSKNISIFGGFDAVVVNHLFNRLGDFRIIWAMVGGSQSSGIALYLAALDQAWLASLGPFG
jgi:hypothetical protein